MPLLDPPAITIYHRVLDAATLNSVTSYSPLIPLNGAVTSGSIYSNAYANAINETLDYGLLNGITGGTSPYIIELDIWNNEPALSGGFQPLEFCDATGLTLFAQDSMASKSIINVAPQTEPNVSGMSVLYARCVTTSENTPWAEINPASGFTNISGNVTPSAGGVLRGNAPGGDHAIIQTKIVLQPNTPASLYNFVFGLTYDYAPTMGSW